VGRAVKNREWAVVSGQWNRRKGTSLGRFLALAAAFACAACTNFAAAQADYRMDSYVTLNGNTQAKQPNSNGNVRLSNVLNVNDPAYRMSAVSGFKTPYEDVRCRYVPDAAFMGVTAKRTVIIWESGGKMTYATRNFDGTPGVYLTGGTRAQDDIGPEYTFNKAGYTYLIKFHPYTAFVQVKQGGRLLQTEPFLAYSISTPLPISAQPNTPTQEQP
jgi:hypothetical protein